MGRKHKQLMKSKEEHTEKKRWKDGAWMVDIRTLVAGTNHQRTDKKIMFISFIESLFQCHVTLKAGAKK